MAISVTDLRSKFVTDTLADLHSETNYLIDLAAVQMDEPLGRGESVEIPALSGFTVAADGTTGASAQSISDSSLHLVANREPYIGVELTLPERVQGLEGALGSQVVRTATDNMMTSMDEAFASYLVTDTAWDASGSYRVNAGAATSTLAHVARAKAKLLSQRGEHNLRLFLHPEAEADMASISDVAGIVRDPNRPVDRLGIDFFGLVHGVQTFVTNSLPRQRTVASTAWDITSNVLTITVPSGHGVVPATKVTFSTATAAGDVSTATAVDSVTATTIVLAKTASNDSATEAGVVTIQATENLLVDTPHCYVARQLLPTAREVPVAGSSKSELQLSSLWGFVARAGRACVIETSV